ncbi:MAG: C-GCAxxG-C-C family protein [Anaerotignum sp.]|nr:C-GCAxxG-C-C family protein [Anaerotignum sp.]
MLKTKVRGYCGLGENCSRVILQAAAEEYGFSLSKDILAACGGINGGFGIGGICSGLVAAVMVLGLLFDEEEVKWKRILFLMKVQERYGSLECGRLSALQTDCKEILEGIADILQEVIEE